MIRSTIILFFLITTGNLVAQLDNKLLKADSLFFSKDSVFVLTYKKSKMGLYDNHNKEFVSKPAKDPIYFMDELELFLKTNENSITAWGYWNGNSDTSWTSWWFSNKLNRDLMIMPYSLSRINDTTLFVKWGKPDGNPDNESIWKLNNGQWLRASPFYSKIEWSQNLYIATTAYDEYLLLDKNCQAISIMDHYNFRKIDDLGFGLKICTDKGCMFVTYDGIAITNDEWLSFTLEIDGRIKAYKEIFVDDGTSSGVKDGVVSFFELPN